MPPVDRDWIAGFAIVVRENGRKLFQNDVSREIFPTVVVPGLGIERVIVAGADRIIPLPTVQRPATRMVRRQHPGNACRRSFHPLIHGELIGVESLVLVDARFKVPPGKVSCVGTSECARSESADRRALPITVVDDLKISFLGARMAQRFANSSFPGRFRNRIPGVYNTVQ